MNALISNPADCEVRGVIRFLQTENVRPCEIHQDLLRSMVNMLWRRPVSENGAQYLGMGEQMFMTLRDQGDPLSSQTHWSKSWTVSFERIDISQLAKCTKLSPNICNTAKFVHVGPAAFWYEEGISKLVSRYDKCLNVQGDYVEK